MIPIYTPPTASASSPHLYPARRPSPLLRARTSHLPRLSWSLVLIIPWLFLIYSTERSVYTNSLSACEWDTWEPWPESATPHRLALIADPQLIDVHTYGRRGPALWATIFYVDLYLGRIWSALHDILVPSDTIFLGDLFDGGREWMVAAHKTRWGEQQIPHDPREAKDWKNHGNQYWLKEYARLQRLFPTPAGTRSYKSLPGNHDLGFGHGVKKSVRERFESYIGRTNSRWEWGNHTFVAIDSVSLSNEVDPEIYNPPKEFLASLSTPPAYASKFRHEVYDASPPPPPTQPSPPEHTKPTILLSHVPLYRAPNTPCGPLRERGTSIPLQYGYQYQNVLTPEISNSLLVATKPKHVFSGDDHDACEITHPGMVKETTVKSVSWAMGVRHPAILLLSLWNPPDKDGEDTVATTMCFLPDQLRLFVRYIWAGLATVAAVVAEVALRRRGERKRTGMTLPVKERDEVGDGKYWKPSKREVRKTGKRAFVMEVGGEIGKVAAVVLGCYWWLIWRW